MTTVEEMMQDFTAKAYDTYALKNQRFQIIEDLGIRTPLREGEEINEKYMKKYKFYLIGIDTGVIQKDLKVKQYEFIEFMLTVPKNTQKLTGITVQVDLNGKMKYVSQAMQQPPINTIAQAMTPTPQAPAQSAPITQPEQNQADKFTGQFLNNITLANKFGKVDTKVLLNLAEDIVGKSNALDLVATTKTKGLITEKDGTYVVV